MGKITLKRNL